MIGLGSAARTALTAFSPSVAGPLCAMRRTQIFLMDLREGIAGRNRLQPEEDVELVRCACLKVPVPAHDPRRAFQLPEGRAAIDRARGVRLEKETGDDAKISTAAAQSPEEIGAVRLVRDN